MTDCGGSCTDTASDHVNCGTCGHECSAVETCVSGECVLECPYGETPCSGRCVDTGSDFSNCGACDHACDAGQVCNEGACTTGCNPGLVNCSGSCVDLSSNRSHCGGCDQPCEVDQGCISGMCQSGCGNRVCSRADGESPCTCPSDCGSCPGCCTPDFCLPGLSDGACGTGGIVCDVCTGSETCMLGRCQSSPETVCTLTITPETGSEDVTFYASLTSNGSDCTVDFDGSDTASIECNFEDLPFMGRDVGVGVHNVTILVGSGPGGPASCHDTFTVTEATTCRISVTPASGTTDQVFYATTETNGSDCTAVYDGIDSGTVECNNTDLPLNGSDLGVGAHSITLNVGAGPRGPASCGDNFTVNP